MNISEVHCKSALVKSRIYGIDYAVNPYTGCEHNCGYCYAAFMKKYTKHTEPWGHFVDAKINAPTVLKKQLKRIKKGRVLFSSVTDAYQPVEEHYKITRHCLTQFINTQFFVSILTKSSLITRDIDVLQSITGEVGFTFTTLDNTIKEQCEPNSSSVKDRLTALKTVHEAGIPTYVFLGPIIPFLSDSPECIAELFSAFTDYAQYVIVDRMNLYTECWKKIHTILKGFKPALIPKYAALKRDPDYSTVLRNRILKVATIPVEFCF